MLFIDLHSVDLALPIIVTVTSRLDDYNLLEPPRLEQGREVNLSISMLSFIPNAMKAIDNWSTPDNKRDTYRNESPARDLQCGPGAIQPEVLVLI